MNTSVKSMTGTVVSIKGQKTLIVAVVRLYRHPLYKKQIRKTKRFAAHNELQTISVGDKVLLLPTRPISKAKHYMVKEKIV